MLVALIRTSFVLDTVPALRIAMCHSEAKRTVCGSIRAHKVRLAVRMDQLPLKQLPHPTNKPASVLTLSTPWSVLHSVSALRGTVAPSAGRLGGIGTGNVKTSALRAGSTSPPAGSNREQALHLKNH